MIVEVLPRRTRLTRRSPVPMPGAHPFEQTIVANADQMVAVLSAASPAPKWNLLDRYLTSAAASGILALVCITKLDLVQDASGALDEDMAAALGEYRQLGYPVCLVSSVTGEGVDALRQRAARTPLGAGGQVGRG